MKTKKVISGNVYVADSGNHRIQKFTSDGGPLGQWGGYGTGNGQFNQPYGIAVDASGNVYVSDMGNNRIRKFDSSGGFITKWGSYGSGDGQLDSPDGVAVDSSGSVYVVDQNNHRIVKFDSDGNFITKWGGPAAGSGNGEFSTPTPVAVDASGNVYVAESQNHRIQKFALAIPDTTPPTISGISPSSPTTLYTRGTSATQTFAASYSDKVGVNSATVNLDGADVTSDWDVGISGFSHEAQLAVGPPHTIFLTVKDAAGNQAQQTWSVTVVQDTSPPTISAYGPTGQIKSTSDVPYLSASFSDSQSGIDTGSVKVLINGVDYTSNAIITSTGVQYPTAKLPAGPGANDVPKGQYTITVQISDKVGNMASVSWDIKLTGSAYKK